MCVSQCWEDPAAPGDTAAPPGAVPRSGGHPTVLHRGVGSKGSTRAPAAAACPACLEPSSALPCVPGARLPCPASPGHRATGPRGHQRALPLPQKTPAAQCLSATQAPPECHQHSAPETSPPRLRWPLAADELPGRDLEGLPWFRGTELGRAGETRGKSSVKPKGKAEAAPGFEAG